jgi:hypothetical protein
LVDDAIDPDLASGALDRPDVPGAGLVLGGDDHREGRCGAGGAYLLDGGSDLVADRGGDGAPVDEPHVPILSRTVATICSAARPAGECLVRA